MLQDRSRWRRTLWRRVFAFLGGLRTGLHRSTDGRRP